MRVYCTLIYFLCKEANFMALREFKVEQLYKKIPLSEIITIAPYHHNYALCIEYVKKWFLDHFRDDFFWNIHLEGSHIFGELNKIKKEDIIKKNNNEKCRLIITPTIDENYDRERIDMNLYGVKSYVDTTTKADRSFFKDPVNNRYILMKMDASYLNFNFRVRCPTRAIQLDLLKYMKLSFRIGLSETTDISGDYVLPYPMMCAVARDCGFKVENDVIKEPIRFLTYLNSRSFVPIVYRRANVTAREEYFVRMSKLPIRFAYESISKDDGNRTGHVNGDYNIEMNINVMFPSMQFFIYYTETNLERIKLGKEVSNIENTLMLALHQTPKLPEVNDKGWKLYLTTEYQAEDYNDRTIHFDELFEGELKALIEYLKKQFIAPQTYIDIIVTNDGVKQEIYLDYDTYHIHNISKLTPTKLVYLIGIYVDLAYLNALRIDTGFQKNARVAKDDNIYV